MSEQPRFTCESLRRVSSLVHGEQASHVVDQMHAVSHIPVCPSGK